MRARICRDWTGVDGGSFTAGEVVDIDEPTFAALSRRGIAELAYAQDDVVVVRQPADSNPGSTRGGS